MEKLDLDEMGFNNSVPRNNCKLRDKFCELFVNYLSFDKFYKLLTTK